MTACHCRNRPTRLLKASHYYYYYYYYYKSIDYSDAYHEVAGAFYTAYKR